MKEYLAENYTSFMKKLWEQNIEMQQKVQLDNGNNKLTPSQQTAKCNPTTQHLSPN